MNDEASANVVPASQRKRRAFYCVACEKEGRAYRKFMTPAEAAEGQAGKRCEIHQKPMAVQENQPYLGKRTDR